MTQHSSSSYPSNLLRAVLKKGKTVVHVFHLIPQSHNPTAKQCFIAKSPKLYQVTFHFLPSQRLQNIFYILCWNCCISNCSGHLLQKGIGLQQICNYLQIINIQTSLITACRSYKITSMIKNLRCVIIKPLRSTLLQAFRQHKSNAFTTDSTDPFLLSSSEEEKIRGKKKWGIPWYLSKY